MKVTDEQLKAAAAAAWQQEQEQIISQIPQSESMNFLILFTFHFCIFEKWFFDKDTASGKVQESASTVPPLSPTKLEGDTSS